jgi:hypothetical protein
MNFMKTVKTLTLLTICVTSLALADDIKTNNGKVYKNATVTREERDGIMIKFSGGIVKIPCAEMIAADQQRFHCDPQKAAAYSAAQAASIQQANQQVEESNKQRREVEQQKGLENRLSQLQQQDERLVEQIRQAEIGADGQKAASQANIQRFEDEAREHTLDQPPVRDEIWLQGGKWLQYAQRHA